MFWRQKQNIVYLCHLLLPCCQPLRWLSLSWKAVSQQSCFLMRWIFMIEESVCVLPRATPNVVYDPLSEAFHSHIVDRIVHPSAFSQCSATTAHNSFKKVFCWIGSKTCDNKTPLPLFNKGRPSGIPLCAKTVLMRDWFCRKKHTLHVPTCAT